MKRFNERSIEGSYRYSPIAEKTREALTVPLRRYSILLKNYTLLVDEETKDIILLIPISDINKANKDLKQIVFNDLRNNIKNANLKILEERPTFADFYRVGFISHMIKISAQ